MLLGRLGIPCVIGLHRGVEGLEVFSGKLVGGLPNEVSDLAVGGQAAQRHVVDVAPKRQFVIATCQAGPGA
jgi:hypothetical protein